MNLYISDLDGTLLNGQAMLTKLSTNLLNDAIKEGINFSLATARTPATVINILKELSLKLPIIVMNGSAIFDIKKKNI